MFNDKTILKSQQRFKSDYHNVCADNKRLQTFDKTTTHPYGTNAFKAYKSEMLGKYKWLILMIMQMKTKQNII